MGVTQHIHQGEGGEQGDPLMPLFFTLGQYHVCGGSRASQRQ